jgi:RNA-directed DNA polymerase
MSTWTPHTYKALGRKKGYSSEYLDLLVEAGRKLVSKGFPVVFSLGHLAALVDVPHQFLSNVVSRRVDPYRVFQIKKRNGKFRTIAVPAPSLLRTQRWIHQYILLSAKTHACSMAYALGCSPYRNAEVHCGAKWLVKVDVYRFFESISERQVYHAFLQMGYRSLLSFELARLTTRLSGKSSRYTARRWKSRKGYSIARYSNDHVGHVPQGAPTSPILANIVCLDLDQKLSELGRSMGCSYTRYSDDIIFSAVDFSRNMAGKLIRDCSSILASYGFRRNLQKTNVIPPGARPIVTGLVVNGDRPKLPSDYRDSVRCHLYFAAKHGVAEHCQRRGFRSILGFGEHLKGLIAYAKGVDPTLGQQWQEQFNKIAWPPI